MQAKKSKLKLLQMIIIASLLLLSSGCENTASLSPSAHHGVLNLQDLDLTNSDPVKLKGEWEFYWNQLLSPQDNVSSDQSQTHFQSASQSQSKSQSTSQSRPKSQLQSQSQINYINLPHSWNNYQLDDQSLQGTGYATFRLNILLDERMRNQQLALKVANIHYSYKLWIEGKLVAEVGKIGTDRESTIPRITTALIPFSPKSESVELVIQVANFHHYRGGVVKNIFLGSADQLFKQTVLKTASELFITGSIISIGIYHLMLFARRRKDKAPLLFGLFCLIWGIRTLIIGEVILTKIFPEFPFEIELKYEYIALFVETYIFAKYIQSMYPAELPARFCRISAIVSLLFSTITIFTPAIIFTHTLLAYEIYTVVYLIVILVIIIKAAFHKREGALLLSIISILSFLTVINDFLYYAEVLHIGDLSPAGLFVFTLAQMYILSNRFANAFAKTEEVSSKLKVTNQKLYELTKTLEDRVAIRTAELAASNEILQKTNEELLQSRQSRRKLLSYITHDLKNPITSIIGYSQVLLDNINPEKSDVYLKYIHDKTLRLNQMLNDLVDLSQLENKSLRFQMQEVEISTYLCRIYEKYHLLVSESGLHFYLDLAETLKGVVVMIDPDRIEQVLYNLISNSLKFTKAGGSISICCSYEVNSDNGPSSVLVKINDTGIGIPQENIPHIFERNFKYYQEEVSNQNGSGLGLAICKEIIEHNGGKIWAESKPKQGSTICFTLPMSPNDVD